MRWREDALNLFLSDSPCQFRIASTRDSRGAPQEFRPTSATASDAENDGNLYFLSSAKACVASSAAAGGMLCSLLNMYPVVEIPKLEDDSSKDNEVPMIFKSTVSHNVETACSQR